MGIRPLTIVLALVPILMIDAAVEMSLVSYMVAFLHGRSTGTFRVNYPPGQNFELQGQPSKLLLKQGHTSNGAAGTALLLVGIGGLLNIWLQKRRARTADNSRPSTLFTSWVFFTILSTLLTLSALIYTFIINKNHSDQTINLAVAAANATSQKYPLEQWTPETWFGTLVSKVPLTLDSDHRKINQILIVTRGWRWNLIPLFGLSTVIACAALCEWVLLQRQGSWEPPFA